MKTFDETIEQTLRQNSEWSGSADELWSKVSSQMQAEPEKRIWTRKPFLFGAATAATVFLAFMLHTMITSVPPDVPQVEEIAPFQTFRIMMLEEPEIYLPGEPVELVLSSYPMTETEPSQSPRLFIWRQGDEEEMLAGEVLLDEEKISGQSSLVITSPVDPGLYRLVVEGSFTAGEQRFTVFAEKTILVEGEISNENDEKN